jgi:hypothetical protein
MGYRLETAVGTCAMSPAAVQDHSPYVKRYPGEFPFGTVLAESMCGPVVLCRDARASSLDEAKRNRGLFAEPESLSPPNQV